MVLHPSRTLLAVPAANPRRLARIADAPWSLWIAVTVTVYPHWTREKQPGMPLEEWAPFAGQTGLTRLSWSQWHWEKGQMVLGWSLEADLHRSSPVCVSSWVDNQLIISLCSIIKVGPKVLKYSQHCFYLHVALLAGIRGRESREIVFWFSKFSVLIVWIVCELHPCTLPFTHVSLYTHSVGDAETSGIRVGDKLLEVNGVSVRGLEHREAGKMMTEGPPVATLLIHTIKPAPTPNGESVLGFPLVNLKVYEPQFSSGREGTLNGFVYSWECEITPLCLVGRWEVISCRQCARLIDTIEIMYC